MQFHGAWKKWLFISPHADDAEFGCGALLSQLARRSDVQVELIVLTSREETTGESQDAMRAYQREALDILGLKRAKLSFARLLSRRLPTLHEEVREALGRVRRDFDPDVIFTTPRDDRMQDHEATALEAARIFRGRTIIEYEVVSSSIAFAPDSYLEISQEDLELKIQALHCHRGQSHKSYFAPDVIRSLARLRGAHSGAYSYCEAFHIQTLLVPAMISPSTSKLSYDENEAHLDSRAAAHSRTSKRDVEEFILEHVAPAPGEVIVDLCCGTGKQSVNMARAVGPSGKVIGLDLQEELLDGARKRTADLPQASFVAHDANDPLPIEDASVDALICCYGIYYMENLTQVVAEIDRVLKPGGRAFVICPARDNNQELRSLHSEVTGDDEPSAITRYRLRTEEEVLPLLSERMNVDLVEFRNELEFATAEQFAEYYRATPLLAKSVPEPAAREVCVERAKAFVEARIAESNSPFGVRKVAVGLVASKPRAAV
jgi:ubiquinone/menaquinone biosynthesis C-methylase UbiE/LmbE family N-acetylglucosaminyl deacetylase